MTTAPAPARTGLSTPVEAAPSQRTAVHWTSVLRIRPAALLLGAALMGRLPLGMVPVALLLAAKADGHSYATGAALVAAYGLSVAAGQPLLGRVVDRYGPVRPLASSASTSAVALTAVAAVGLTRLWLAATAVIIAGLSAAPVDGTLRSLWPRLVPETHLRAARDLGTGSGELVYVAGPLATTAMAAAFGPGTVLCTAAGLGTAGAVGISLSTHATIGTAAGGRSLVGGRGVLRGRGMRLLLLASTAVGAGYGAFLVSAVAAADRHGTLWLAGTLPAVVSLSAILGTAVFTTLSGSGSLPTHLTLTSTVFALGWLPFSLLDPPPELAVALAVLPGLAFGPILACVYSAADALAPNGTLVEAVGWLIAALSVGDALGTTGSGLLAGSWSAPAAAAALALPVVILLGPTLASQLTGASTTANPFGQTMGNDGRPDVEKHQDGWSGPPGSGGSRAPREPHAGMRVELSIGRKDSPRPSRCGARSRRS